MTINGKLDKRFGETDQATDWSRVDEALTNAELYWLTTVRGDGRPHVTPLVGVWVENSFVFCTGPDEQKARNLERNSNVVVTTGANSWKEGLDVVVEGSATRLTGTQTLTPLADAYREKYSGEWDFAATDEGFGHPDGGFAHVFRVAPSKVIAFAKSPHGQTTFRF
ncbi:MAG TPA: pyridoxamine 5'-phosphate oxidase family protein [Mycobacterium sp.]|nr:pyridoxamine 5'-phosphate oxidase family protein [Mycobacterium sp.]